MLEADWRTASGQGRSGVFLGGCAIVVVKHKRARMSHHKLIAPDCVTEAMTRS
jgi:hypothetical protein